MPKVFISSVWDSSHVRLMTLREKLWEIAPDLQLNGEPWIAWIDKKDDRLELNSDPDTWKPICLQEVAKSDLYVGLFAERYGTTRYGYLGDLRRGKEEEDFDLSLTELELHQAVAHGRAIRLYIFKGEFDRSPGLKSLLDIILEDKILQKKHICWTTEQNLLDDFKKDLELPKCLNIFKVSPFYINNLLLLRNLKIGVKEIFPLIGFGYDCSILKPKGFNRDYVEKKISDMERFYSLKLYQDVIQSGIDALIYLRKLPPFEPKHKIHIPLWIRFFRIWNKATNWIGLDGKILLGDLNAAKILRELYQHTGKLEDLYEFYWIDGAIASCLHNLGSTASGQVIQLSLFQNALKRIERALKKAEDHPQLKAGFLDIKASLCARMDFLGDACNAIKESLQIRECHPQFPADSFGNTLIKFGWLMKDYKKIEEGLSICSRERHPGFEASGRLDLAEIYLNIGEREKAREEIKRADVLAQNYHLRRCKDRVMLLTREIEKRI
jgi:tetratricopeptide (TPR) repeat protein